MNARRAWFFERRQIDAAVAVARSGPEICHCVQIRPLSFARRGKKHYRMIG
ncbi:hypothetical protein BRPE64_BCDS11550 [Caballeronia insecticola]|uniref:Uncharacterized protein n=1 Tax=Caballeronia insecticola TaxID=758793 RepID=R4X0Z3_9BURK|nr:hypothetical protein BRPE64_BCDS11550 [Caballeronia insecticola]